MSLARSRTWDSKHVPFLKGICPCHEHLRHFWRAVPLLGASVSPRELCLWPAQGTGAARDKGAVLWEEEKVPNSLSHGNRKGFRGGWHTPHTLPTGLAAGQQRGGWRRGISILTIPLGMRSPERAPGSEPRRDTQRAARAGEPRAALLPLLRKRKNSFYKVPVFPRLLLWLSKNVFCCVRV